MGQLPRGRLVQAQLTDPLGAADLRRPLTLDGHLRQGRRSRDQNIWIHAARPVHGLPLALQIPAPLAACLWTTCGLGEVEELLEVSRLTQR